MAVVGEIMMTPRIYRAAIKEMLRKAFIRQRVLGGMFVVMGVVVILFDDGSSSSIGVGFGLILAGLLFSLFLPSRGLSLSVKYAAPTLTGVWRYQVSEAGVWTHDPLVSSSWPWTSVTGAVEYPEFWLLSLPLRNRAIVLAKAAFTVEGQHAIAELLARMGKSAPRKTD